MPDIQTCKYPEPNNQVKKTPWLMYLIICVIGVTITGLMGYGFFNGDRLVRTYAPLVDACMEIKIEVSNTHLWLEELLGGDSTMDVRRIWEHQKQAEWYAEAMLEGGQNAKGTFIPLDDAEMRKNIIEVQTALRAFKNIAQKRLANRDVSKPGSNIDKQYDRIYSNLLKKTDDVESRLHQVMVKNLLRFRNSNIVLLITSILLFLAIGIFFGHFDNQRIKNLLMLNKLNRDLKASEENLSITLNSIGDAFIATDVESKVTRMNPVAEELTGWKLSDAKGRPITEVFNIINENTREKVESPVEKVIREGVIVGLANHTALISKSGIEYTIADSGAPIKNDQGEIFGVILVFRDITEQAKAKAALSESESRYKEFVEGTSDLITRVDGNGDILFSNHMSEEIFGLSSKDCVGLSAFDFVHPDDRSRTMQWFYDKIKSKKTSGRLENRQVNKTTGEVFHMLWASNFHYDKNENILGVNGIARDITESKKAEQELKWRTELNQTLLDALPCIALLLRPGSREVVACNKAGRDAGAVPGKTCYETWGQSTEPCSWCLAPELWKKNEPQEKEFKGGGVYWDAHWIPIDKDLYLHYAFDITERKKIEEQLKQAQKMESIGTLAGGIAHDFNNILSPIMIHAEMAMDDLEPDDPLLLSMQEIYKAGERARDLVKQILTFARKRSEEKIMVNASPIIKDAINFIRSTIPSTIDIRFNGQAAQDTVLADPTQLNQIVMNLCANAAHAMNKKGGLLEVTLDNEEILDDEIEGISGLKPGTYLKLTVSDTGSGISPDDIDRIFEPYYTTKRPGEGTGLGLATVHGIVKNYGGDIKVESKIGKGTTFHVYLPMTERKTTILKMGDTELPGGNERILFVDDEESAVRAAQKMLERVGYSVTSSTNSLETLETFRKNPEAFDLIITDMTMPNMTGKELASEIKKVKPEIPIILCTGFSDQIDETKAKKIDIDAFIMKPIIRNEIVNTIRDVLDKIK